jgi:hypothetical protein
MGIKSKLEKSQKIETTLYEWLNLTEKVELEICKLLDGEISKKDLIKINHEVKVKFRFLESLIKAY